MIQTTQKWFLVYRVVNKINDAFYIGVTSGKLQKRRREHLCSARTGSAYVLHKAIRKYGEENFVFEPLVYCLSMKDALAEEIRYIGILKPRYNLTMGGEGILGFQARLGMKNSEESKEKTRRALVGVKHTLERRQNISAARKGKGAPWNIGRVQSIETRAKISAARKGVKRKYIPESAMAVYRDNMRRAAANRQKPVICLYDGREFVSARSAADYYGLNKTSVSAVCGGSRKQSRGLTFRWKEAA